MLGKKIWDIFQLVKSNFTYVSDQQQHGLREAWIQPDESYDGTQPIKGDCEDFALACRSLLLKAGIKSRLIVCKTESGELHCVVGAEDALNVIHILDNRNTYTVSKAFMDERYETIKVSDYEPGGKWFKVKKE